MTDTDTRLPTLANPIKDEASLDSQWIVENKIRA